METSVRHWQLAKSAASQKLRGFHAVEEKAKKSLLLPAMSQVGGFQRSRSRRPVTIFPPEIETP